MSFIKSLKRQNVIWLALLLFFLTLSSSLYAKPTSSVDSSLTKSLELADSISKKYKHAIKNSDEILEQVRVLRIRIRRSGGRH